jgi:hypothetical protein
MVKSKRNVALTALLVASILILFCVCCFMNGNTANADAQDESGDAQTRGLMTRISISIGSYGDIMYARAANDLTIGFSTVQVYVYLYSSPNYQYTYRNMTLEKVGYTADLNWRDKIEVLVPINGEEKYWRARMQYKFDNKDWVSAETNTYLVNADGMLL